MRMSNSIIRFLVAGALAAFGLAPSSEDGSAHAAAKVAVVNCSTCNFDGTAHQFVENCCVPR